MPYTPMSFKEFLMTEMTWEEFQGLQDQLHQLLISLFGKKKVKRYPTDDFEFSMGTRWGRLKMSKGTSVPKQVGRPYISIEFQWDKTGKSGPVPNTYQADTVWDGSFAFARTLKEIARWAHRNGVGFSYSAEPDRGHAYNRVLTKMGFQQPANFDSGYRKGGKFFPTNQEAT